MRIKKGLVNCGRGSWCREWWKFLWRWERRARVDLFQPSTEVRRVDTVWCAATGEELLWFYDDKATLCMHLYVKGCE